MMPDHVVAGDVPGARMMAAWVGRSHTEMSARDWIRAGATVAMMACISHVALAERLDRIEPPLRLEAPEQELPDTVDLDDLMRLWPRLWWAGCRTQTCITWLTTAELYDEIYRGHGPPGMRCGIVGRYDCADIARVTSKRLNQKISVRPAWHPQLCDAIATVAARDGTSVGYFNRYPDFAAFTLDLARRLTTPKLACLTKVWRALQPGSYRDEAMERALSFCRDERASARECARLTAATRGAGSPE